jgi:hypothetical protein
MLQERYDCPKYNVYHARTDGCKFGGARRMQERIKLAHESVIIARHTVYERLRIKSFLTFESTNLASHRLTPGTFNPVHLIFSAETHPNQQLPSKGF